MQDTNTAIILLVVIATIILLLFLIIKNRKDRKQLFKPGATDPVEETKTEDQRRKDDV